MIHLNPQWLILLNAAAETGRFRFQVPDLPMFSLELQTFVQMFPPFLSFVILVLVFKRFLYVPVKNILQKRADIIEADIQNAAENKASAEELRLEYEQKIKNIELERSAILEEARKEATVRLNQILGEAKEEAQITRDRAKRDIIAEQERVKAGIHQAIIDIATDMAAKLVTANIDKANHARLFEEAMEELETTAFRADFLRN